MNREFAAFVVVKKMVEVQSPNPQGSEGSVDLPFGLGGIQISQQPDLPFGIQHAPPKALKSLRLSRLSKKIVDFLLD